MLQLVKANADLPQMVYLIPYDFLSLSNSIGAELRVNGADFLDKIIQVPLGLPVPDRDDLEDMLTAQLNELLKLEGVEQRFNSERWFSLYRDGIVEYFTTPRRIIRYLSALR